MPTGSTIIVLLALTLAGAVVVLIGRVTDYERIHAVGRALSWVPSLAMVAAFLADVSGRKALTFAAGVLSMIFFVLSWLGAWLLARRSSALSTGGLYSLITIVGVLYTFGSLLQVRLDYQRDPASGPFEGAAHGVGEFLVSQGTPLIVLALAIIGLLAASFLTRLGRHRPNRFRDWVAAHPNTTGATSIALVVGAFFLPLAGSATNGAHLMFFGIQVSEWVRPIWILVAASLLARFRHYVNWRSVSRFRPGGIAWAVALVVLVGGVAAAGRLRSDFGMVLPLVFATPVMILTLSHQERDAWLSSMGHRDSVSASPLSSRVARKVGVVATAVVSATVLLLVNFTLPGLKGRQEAWQNPWQFAWTIECTRARQVPDWLTPGAGYTDAVPAGYELCIELQRDAIASGNSQTARALTVIDGGGLWGRGLSDTEAGIVPVRNADFVLASVWSKFGGLAVLLSTLLVITLWFLFARRISRARWQGRTESSGDRAHIYAAGVGAAIAGQAVYVLLATTNVVWLTGVPFPFLARGGQAMGGLMLGIVLLLWLVQRKEPAERQTDAAWLDIPSAAAPGPAKRAQLAVLRSLGLWVATFASVLGLVVGIVMPFASWQKARSDAGLENPGVQTQLRARGLAPVLTIDGEVAFEQERTTGSWSTPDGLDPPLDLHDLFGVIRTANGASMGLLEGTSVDLLQNTIERTVGDRLRQTTVPRRVLKTTIDPTLQTVAAQAVRAPVEGSDRLPAGVVVLDANSGAIRALSTAPDELNPLDGRASQDEVDAWYNTKLGNTAWGEMVGDTIRQPGEADCSSVEVVCGRYQLRPVTDPMQEEEYLRTYVGGDAAFDLPNPDQNRAVGRRYNLGSTFKVVIAAAYLEGGGRIDDQISSPDYVEVGGQLIGPRCRSTTGGKITLADALRVSCNPAFIQLARDLGWDAIAPVAERLGFTAVGREDAQNDDSLWPAAAHIPASVDYQSIGTNAIGGDLVASTPFQMAAMIAAIANGGVYHEPYLVASIGDGDRTTTNQVEGSEALSPDTARQLQAALEEVTGEGGTLADVEYDDSKVRFYGKTGTHVAREESASGQYTARYFWVVGAAEQKQGRGEPVAFAIVVEGRDAQLGHAQVRSIAAKILDSYAKSER